MIPEGSSVVHDAGDMAILKGPDGRFYLRDEEGCTMSGPDFDSAMKTLNGRREFWAEKIAAKHAPTTVRAGGQHYFIGPEDSRGMRGFDGAKVAVRFHDGRTVVTTNLWTNGTIPAALREQLPDNATLEWFR